MKNWIARFYLGFIYTLLYFPIAILVLYSFNDARFSLVWHHFSFQWYVELFQDRDLWQAFMHSLLLGIVSSTMATVLGFFTCIHLFLRRKPHQSLFALLFLLIILPDLVLGVTLLVFFNMLSIHLGFLSLFIAHVTFCLPFVIITLHHRMQTLDINLYYSAVDLGASHGKTIVKIILPLLKSALLSAFLLGFTLSFDDVIISYFVSGPAFNILPLTIYSLVRAGVTPELNALCSMTFLLSMALVITAHKLSRNSL